MLCEQLILALVNQAYLHNFRTDVSEISHSKCYISLSMSELKAVCVSQSIEVVGDKRSKVTYINAIETFQSEQTIIEIVEMPAIPDPFESQLELAIETEPVDLPPVPTNQHRQASIVVLIPLILLSLAIISIRIGIGALILLIAAVGQLSVSVWGSILRTLGTKSISIDYFPA